MKAGDKIRLVRVPAGVKDDDEFNTRTLLEKCVGRVFTIEGFQSDRCVMKRRRSGPEDWVELNIGEVIPGLTDTIWVEPECVELLKRNSNKRSPAR